MPMAFLALGILSSRPYWDLTLLFGDVPVLVNESEAEASD